MAKFKPANEWFAQSDYDFDTAEALFKSGRYVYVVFMCHLAVEKALKAIVTEKLAKEPPKVHDLAYLCRLAELVVSEKIKTALLQLNDASVPARYPEQLNAMSKLYSKTRTEKILHTTREVLQWVKQNRKK
jgi:HEPN domain-containing protein